MLNTMVVAQLRADASIEIIEQEIISLCAQLKGNVGDINRTAGTLKIAIETRETLIMAREILQETTVGFTDEQLVSEVDALCL